MAGHHHHRPAAGLPDSPRSSVSSGSPVMAPAAARPPPPPPPAPLGGRAAAPAPVPGHLTPRASEDNGGGVDDGAGPHDAGPRIEKMLVSHFYSGRNCSVRGFVANSGTSRYLLFFLDVATVQALDNDHVVAMGDLCNMPNFQCDRLVFCLRQSDVGVLKVFIHFLVKFMGCRLETAGTMFGYKGPHSESDWIYYSMEVGCPDV